MKLKLDENLGQQAAGLFRKYGHDAATVPDQNLCSTSDANLIEVCKRESRCLVTLDLDFGNPLLFKPSLYAGIAILRLPSKPEYADLIKAVETLIRAMSKQEINGRLWIIQGNRVREYQEEAGGV